MAPKSLPDEWEKYQNAIVKKHFPGFGTYEGYVDKIEKDADDDQKIFFVKYPTDGDREWIDLEELKTIVQADDDDKFMYYDPKQAVKRKKKDAPAPAGKRAKTAKAPKANGGKAAATRKAAVAEATAAAKASSAATSKKSDKPRKGTVSSGKAGDAADQPATASGSQESHKGAAGKGKAAADDKATGNGGAASIVSPPAVCNNAATTSAVKASAVTTAPVPTAEVSACLAEKEAAAPAAKPKAPAAAPAASNKDSAAPAAPASTAAPARTAANTTEATNYSQVVVKDNFVFLAGQAASDTTSAAGRTYEGQIKQVFAKINKLLEEAGTSKENMATVTVYLRDLEVGAPVFNSLWDGWVNPTKLPVRTMVKAEMVGQGVLVEINCIASMQ